MQSGSGRCTGCHNGSGGYMGPNGCTGCSFGNKQQKHSSTLGRTRKWYSYSSPSNSAQQQMYLISKNINVSNLKTVMIIKFTQNF